VKVATNRFDMLTLQAGVWTNASSQTLAFSSEIVYRDLSLATNYYSFFEFADGDPNTAEADYYYWELSIDDPNDTDHDGIPDFSDDPLAPPRRPVLKLMRGTTNLWLRISGDTNHLHEIQSVTNLTSTNWLPVTSLMLTNDPQTNSLSIPTRPTFWRARAQ
jgi:hypothetical protein